MLEWKGLAGNGMKGKNAHGPVKAFKQSPFANAIFNLTKNTIL